MRRSVVARVALLAGAVAAVAGCSAPPQPEVTFFADGETERAAPLRYCDAMLTSCEPTRNEPATLDVRPGQPVQVSVPSEVARTPWVVNVQYLDDQGRPQPVRQEVFTSRERHAYTVLPEAPGDQLLVVEVQQLGAAYAADAQGAPILDEAGQPQLVARAVWSLRIQPA